MIGLGIDTGGTCTDAVIYDFDSQQVLSTGKTLTTKGHLETGIEKALNLLEKEKLREVSFVSLSTTLATNACVENKGGRVKLLFIGVKEEIVKRHYKQYGFDGMDDLYFIDGVPEGGFCRPVEPDWEKLEGMMDEFKEAEAIGIVQYFPEWNDGAYERQAKERFEKRYSVPVICGSFLFSDVNAIMRGAGTYLNIRLIPLIDQFLCAVKCVLKRKGLNLPIYVVRSDGTLMNETFTKNHPVETLLCGPAASAVGGSFLSKEKDALIVDIGGTTTDMALLRNGMAVTVKDGIRMNGWKTFVKGLYIDTVGLGGDSCIRYNEKGLYLENFRVMPVAMAAACYPELLEKLKQLPLVKKLGKGFVFEGFVLQDESRNAAYYDEKQLALIERLKDGPILYEEAAHLCGRYYLEDTVKQLEKEGVLLRFGITPTDAMHVKGDYNGFDGEASRIVLRFLAKLEERTENEIADEIYALVERKLYCNIVRVLLEKGTKLYQNGIPEELSRFIEYASEENQSELIVPGFFSKLSIVGVGGPAHIFMEKVGKKLSAKVCIPPYSMAANAVGTLAGRIAVTDAIELSFGSEKEKEGFRFFLSGEKKIVEDFEEAVEIVTKYLEKTAEEKLKERGGRGEVTFFQNVDQFQSNTGGKSLLLGGRVTVTAYCGI
ncbi:MAG: hydantoinase/oxoprolinase family protein [Lachnospiraceae bacterium]|nr:hydantoinase/oxoprolinase family protein [Lachnospiraceae bacterium]